MDCPPAAAAAAAQPCSVFVAVAAPVAQAFTEAKARAFSRGTCTTVQHYTCSCRYGKPAPLTWGLLFWPPKLSSLEPIFLKPAHASVSSGSCHSTQHMAHSVAHKGYKQGNHFNQPYMHCHSSHETVAPLTVDSFHLDNTCGGMKPTDARHRAQHIDYLTWYVLAKPPAKRAWMPAQP